MTQHYFVNFTNHPFDRWEEAQKAAALEYGEVADVPFPAVDPLGDEGYIDRLARQCVERILCFHPRAVLCQGEFCLAYQVITRLQKQGLLVLAACSERTVKEAGRIKEVKFTFRQFRSYGKDCGEQ